MSHTVMVHLIGDQVLGILGKETNIHDIETLYIDRRGKIIDIKVKLGSLSNWRPEEGWKNPYGTYVTEWQDEFVEGLRHSAFEEGADAMLDVLFKLAKESPTGTYTIAPDLIRGRGY